MFVEIENRDMNEHNVDKWIKLTRKDSGDIISPEFAMKILSKTNHIANIKTVLKNIKAQCVDENKKLVLELVLPYREFILSCVDGREQSEMIMTDLRDLAGLCGCKDELETINNKPKFYEKTDCLNMRIMEDIAYLFGKEVKAYIDLSDVSIDNVKLFKIKAIKFKEHSTVTLRKLLFVPSIVDVSGCDKISIEFCNLPKQLKFGEGADVTLGFCGELPEDFDISKCSSVTLFNCDASKVKEFKVREDGAFHLNCVENIPHNFDLSKCAVVELKNIDISNCKDLKFREGAVVSLFALTNIPENLDLSKCKKVILEQCDLSNLEELKFEEGAEVKMLNMKSLPKVLDVSACSYFFYKNCNFENVETLILKNREQVKDNYDIINKFKGKNIVYTEKNKSIFSRIKKRFGLNEVEM